MSQDVDIPIGIIDSTYGGSDIQAWCKKEFLVSNAGYLESDFGSSIWNNPSVLFNAMINPLKNVKITGVVWYQGEHNVSIHKLDYLNLLNTLLQSFENNFNKNEIPFYLVQIPFINGYLSGEDLGKLTSDQMEFVNSNLYTEIISIGDTIIDINNIHPPTKNIVGFRLAKLAINKYYSTEYPTKVDDIYNGPIISNIEMISNKVVLEYSNAISGLTTWNNLPLTGYQIAANDEVFYYADALINGSTVELTNVNVPIPQYVRTGYSDEIEFIYNLSNYEGYCSPSFSISIP